MEEHPSVEMDNIKAVIVGDTYVGKTCILLRLSASMFNEEYKPTVFDSYSTQFNYNDKNMNLTLWDTSGENEYDRYRPLSYSKADVFLMCFSLIDKNSLENIKLKWIKEIRLHAPSAPIILVGTKYDIRENLIQNFEKSSTQCSTIIHPFQGEDIVKKYSLHKYIECSSAYDFNIRLLFEQCVVMALHKKVTPPVRKRKGKCYIL